MYFGLLRGREVIGEYFEMSILIEIYLNIFIYIYMMDEIHQNKLTRLIIFNILNIYDLYIKFIIFNLYIY